MLDRIPQVFLSYSWTSKEYQQNIIELATRMRHDGVDVKLDVWDLKEGQDKYAYMEQCVTNPEIDKVLIFSDRLYTEKANKRSGGVGNETTIISDEVYGHANQQKFIPIVMERDELGNEYLPSFLKSRLYLDFSSDNYEEEYEKLIRIIYDAPSQRKPEIGTPPSWLTEDSPDDLYQIKEKTKKISLTDLSGMKKVEVRDFVDTYIEAIKQFYVSNIDNKTYLENFKKMNEYRDVFLDHLNVFSKLDSFGKIMADEFERMYNVLFNAYTFDPKTMSCRENDFDLFRLHIWELFLCTVTYMLHFELYQDIHDLLVHTYFIRKSGLGSEKVPASYEKFCFYSKMLEENIKPTLGGDLSRKYTLMGHFVCTQREFLPIYSGRAMANADLFLYQVYNGLKLGTLTQWFGWFPTLYVYADECDSIWKRLKSRQFCESIMPVFGVKTVDKLKEVISKCIYDRSVCYSNSYHDAASAILTWIDLDEVAILP